ncbi:MAG: hypothetical protein IJA69_02255 [Clostridia bacterium]|nr:hypothetical protein [Clostridia bacterium]
MSKKKKFFVIIFVLALVVGGVFLAIHLLSPKADLKAPYENLYAVANNDKLTNIAQNNDNMLVYLSEMQTLDDDNLKTKAQALGVKYGYVEVLLNVYEKTNYTFETNLNYLTDGEGLSALQKNLTNSHKAVLEHYETLDKFINTQIKPITAREEQASWDMLNTLANYDVLFDKFLQEYSSFYALAGQTFAYVTNSMQANPYTKQNMLSITAWAKAVATKIASNQVSDIKDGTQNLQNFTDSVIVSNPSSYFNNFAELDAIVSAAQTLGDEAYAALATNSQYNVVANIQDADQKAKLEKVFKEYFEVELVTPQGGE